MRERPGKSEAAQMVALYDIVKPHFLDPSDVLICEGTHVLRVCLVAYVCN